MEMKFSEERLRTEHNKHLKEVYGDDIFTNKDKPINYGWGEDEQSICTKIYKEGGHQYLSTFYNKGRYDYECDEI